MWIYNMRIFAAICCLCGTIRPLKAKTLSEENSVLPKAPDVQKLEAQMFSPPDGTVNSGSLLVNTIQAQNASIQSDLQKSPNAPRQSHDPSPIHLNMSLDSVDDMYYGCSEKMLIKVKNYYLPNSIKEEGLCTNETMDCANRLEQIKDPSDRLTCNHFQALCAYTDDCSEDFNRAVQHGKSFYRTSFQFHALHFLLSDAISILKVNQQGCRTSYRRSWQLFHAEVGQTIRFGFFASSSLINNLHNYGSTTCFEIQTCMGAHLKSYTEFDSLEEEVLIPPYEMFTIVSVVRSGANPLNCNAYYQLQSAGIHSSLNCQDVNP